MGSRGFILPEMLWSHLTRDPGQDVPEGDSLNQPISSIFHDHNQDVFCVAQMFRGED